MRDAEFGDPCGLEKKCQKFLLPPDPKFSRHELGHLRFSFCRPRMGGAVPHFPKQAGEKRTGSVTKYVHVIGNLEFFKEVRTREKRFEQP